MKKIIAAALGLAFAAPFAMADVTIYGSIRESVEYYKGDAGVTAAATPNAVRMVDSSSRIGFRGTDKWDNGWTGIWQLETGLGAKAGTNTYKSVGGGSWGGRNSFIGFKSDDFGTFRAGNYDNSYKTMLTSSKLSPLFDDFLDTVDPKGGKGTFAQLATRLNDSLSWDSPVWAGFQVRANVGLDSAPAASGKAPIYDVTALYNLQGFNAGVSYQYAKNRTFNQVTGISNATYTGVATNITNGADVQGLEAVVAYNFDFGLGLGAGIEHIKNEGANGTDTSWNNYMATVNYWFNQKFELQGLYTKSNNVNGVGDTDGQQYSLSAVYYMSKQTRLYLSYVDLKNSGDATNAFSFQNNSASLVAANGQDLKTGLVGIRTDF
ncbi:hypothetical protein JCM19000A_25900 [Silvimonas sp. JCM 19000]